MSGRAAVVLRTTTGARGRSTGPAPERSLRRALIQRCRNAPLDSTSGRALARVINLSPQRSCGAGDSLKKLMLAGLVAVLGFAPVVALAQAQAEEKMLVGQVQSVDESGTKITLTDGTKQLPPPGAVVRPGALPEGATVVAMYREENGDKILTKLALRPSAPVPSTPSES